MDFQDAFAPFYIRSVDHYLPVESAGSEQGGVKYIGTIRGGDHDDRFVGCEAVHFHEQLVESLLAFIVATHDHRAAPGATDRVQLIDKNNARGLFPRLLEQVAHPGRTVRSPTA